ncbi:MAG: large repetitive protein, partial [Frankiaceae bacterium]|nr:large repetitive protein [Frankiaceae bacterium]
MTVPVVEVHGPIGAAPGRPVTFDITIRNTADQPQAMLVSVVGLDTDWVPLPVQTAPIAVGEAVTLALTVTPQAGSPAGSYGFVVAAQPVDPVTRNASGPMGEADAAVVVGDPGHLAMELSPAEPEALRTRRVSLLLGNKGTEPMSLELKTTTPVGVTFDLKKHSVELAPGETTKVRGRLSVERGRLVGQSRRHPFIVTAQGRTTPLRLDGVFVAHPVFNRQLTRLVALLAVVAVWASVALLAVNAISKHAQNKNGGTTTIALPANGNGNGSGGGGAGAGKGGKGGGKAGGSTSASSATRLNGTVTGASPGHVRVSIRPTSLVDEQATGAQPVNVAAASTAGWGKLSASVVDLGHPAANAVVRTTSTAADGSFAFAGVASPGYYLVTLSKAGFQTRKFIIQASAGKPLPTLEVPLAAGAGRLSGHIGDLTGKALGGATVTVTNGAVTLNTSTPTTGHIGRWSVDGLSTPGTYLVSATRDGFDTESLVVKLGPSGSAVRNIALKPGVQSLIGAVTGPNLNGLGGATVTVTNGNLTRTTTTLTTDPIGAYTLPRLPIGDYTVTVGADGYAPQTGKVTLNGHASSLTKNAQLTSSTATVGGSIVDITKTTVDQGVGSAGLILSGDNGVYKTTSLTGSGGATSGGFSFTGVAPGDYVLTVQAFGYLANFVSVTTHAGDDLAVPPINLQVDSTGGVLSTSKISGHVVDAHTGARINCPATVTDCRVHIHVTPPDGAPPLVDIAVAADQDYTVPGTNETDPAYAKGLPPGLYHLTFSFTGYQPTSLAVAVPEGSVVSAVPVALIPDGLILGHINTTTTALDGCVIATPVVPGAAPPTHVPAGIDCGTLPTVSTATSPESCADNPHACIGQIDPISHDYEIDFVPQGTYWVFVRPETSTPVPHTASDQFVTLTPVQLTVEAGQSRRYDTSLDQFASVQVLVQEPNSVGDAATVGAGVDVVLNGPGGATLLPSIPTGQTCHCTDGNGLALFPRVPAGTYTASATHGLFSGTTGQFGVGVNQQLTSPLVLTKASASVVGQVFALVDGARVPVPGATVHISGITGYTGSVPIRTAFTLRTNLQGCFAIQSSGASVSTLVEPAECAPAGTPLPLPAFPVTGSGLQVVSVGTTLALPPDAVSVDATGATGFERYGVQRIGSVNFGDPSSATGIALTPPTTTVTGSVTLQPVVAPATVAQVSMTVTQHAPGAGNIVVSVDSAGAIHWRDSSLSSAAQNADQAVPGTYHLRASLDGYDTVQDVTLVVPLQPAAGGSAAVIGPITLDALGALTFTSRDAATGADLPGATFTLSGASISPSTLVAPPGTSTVSFPGLSPASGPYQLDVHAAGYAFRTVTAIAVTPGAPPGSAAAQNNVDLTKLARITGQVKGFIGDHTFPISGASVTATNGTDTFGAVTDETGRYTILGTVTTAGLVPGTDWDLSASAFGYDDGTATVTNVQVTDGARGDITLNATPIGSVTISVQDDTSGPTPVPVSGAHVTLVGAGNTYHADTLVSGDAVFTVGLAPTTYSLNVTGTNFSPLSTSVTLRVGVDPQTFFVTLAHRTNTISGTIAAQNADGTPKTTWVPDPGGDGLSA